MFKETIFIDESGNAGLQNQSHNTNHPYFIVGFTFCRDPLNLKYDLHGLLGKLQTDGKYPTKLKELKFYPYRALQKAGYSNSEIQNDWQPHFDHIRKETVSIIAKHSDGLFAGILNKLTIKQPTWKPETIGNYLINKSLFYNILPKIKFQTTPEVLYDKGRLSHDKTKKFDQYMLNTDSYLDYKGIKPYTGSLISIKDVNSVYNSGIWASDFVAGAFHHAIKQNNDSFLSILKPKFIGNGSLNLWF